MAARTSTSIGMGATVTILAVATLGLFVTSMVFFAQRREALNQKAEADKVTKDFLSDADRNDAVIMRLKEDALKKRQTVVRYLLEERKDIMSKSTGSDRDTVEAINKVLEASKGTSLVGVIRERDAAVDSLTKQKDDADAARQRALQDKENETKRVKTLEDAQKATVAALSAEVDKTKAESEAQREEWNKFKASMDDRVNKIREDALGKENMLKAEIDKLQTERAVNRDRLLKYEQEQRGTRYSGPSEYALVDGNIVASSAVEGTVTLNVGRKQKVVLGLPFTVYTQGTNIRVDDRTGEYPPGKAVVEVIRVDEDTSTARVLREQKGNPVVKGDVIANPVYDASKKYKFLVYGNFDPQRTGSASVFGTGEIKAWIKEWSGEIIEEMTGDVDFIVLGQRPQLPPQPSSAAPLEVVNFYIAQQRSAQKYDELFKQASDTAIPVLNENRLRTLLGR